MKKSNTTPEIINHDVVVKKAILCKNGNVLCDVTINDVTIYGCFFVEGEKDGKHYELLSFPSEKGKDGKYYNKVFCRLSEEDVTTIKNMCQRIIDNE